MWINIVSFCLLPFATLPSFLGLGETLYMGIENKIRLSLHGCTPAEITVKASAGSLYKRDDSTYILVPQQDAEEIKVKLYYQKVICDIKTLAVKRLPDLIPHFEGEQMGFITRQGLNKPGRLRFIYPTDYPQEMYSSIISYSLLLYNQAGQIVWQGNVRGDTPDAKGLAEMARLGKGGKLYITNIMAQNPRQGTQRLNINKEVNVTD
ncbi:MAG: hypothetical protein LW630_11140 [Saprospiraceae bacterium]|jgi:hypothetical protein|nr:hypothetical protein [Saprospiraceae bacterium]